MPQQRAASSTKRKASSDSDGEKPVGSKQQSKKAKVTAPARDPAAEQNGLAPNGQPTNKVLPVEISFPPRAENVTRIASWNICSLASSQKKVR
jgi:AP endonuclease 1